MKIINHLKSFNSIIFFLLFFTLVVLEYLSAKIAYFTLGWFEEGFTMLLILLNIIPIILYLTNKKKIAFLILIGLGLYIIPQQIILTKKLLQLREESSNIISYVYRYKIVNEDFPKDINMYEYKYQNLKKHFNYKKFDDDFQLVFYVGTRSTHNFIQHSEPNQWNYVDD